MWRIRIHFRYSYNTDAYGRYADTNLQDASPGLAKRTTGHVRGTTINADTDIITVNVSRDVTGVVNELERTYG